MKKPRHVSLKNGKYFYVAKPPMIAAGVHSEPLGDNKAAAYARATVLNADWDEARVAKPDMQRGDFADLIDQFQRDPVWYGTLARVTQSEIDYSFVIIEETFGAHRVTALNRRHCRVFYNRIRVDGSAHKAHRVMKWFKRLLNYAVEIEVRDFNPADRMKMESLPGRDQIWHASQVTKYIETAVSGGKASSGNIIPARPSVGLMVQLGIDTAQREQDLLALVWTQYDGEGITVRQLKTGKRLWVPLSQASIDMINVIERTSTHIVVSELTGRPYSKDAFTRIFRKFARRAGIPDELQFRDLRRTAATELGNTGSSEAEIVAFTGHEIGSSVIKTYVKPDRHAALRAAKKRGSG